MRFMLLFLVVAACTFGFTVGEDDPQSKKESVTFDGKTLFLAFEGENPGEVVKEYIPEGQKLESWEQLASIREYANLDDPRVAVEELVKNLKQQYPLSPHKVTHHKQSDDVIVDFVIWPEDLSFVEFNVFRYAKKEGGGLIAKQYAVRDYTDGKKFLRDELKPLRERLVTLMAEKPFELKAVEPDSSKDSDKTSEDR